MEKHYGQTLEYLVRKNGFSISEIAQKLNVNRRSIYNHFQQKHLKVGILLQYVQILKIDLTSQFPELIDYKNYVDELVEHSQISSASAASLKETLFWKEKYIELLERYNSLLLTHLNEQK